MLSLLAAPTLAAICSTASIEQAYREADVVAHVRVVAETRITDDEPSAAWQARWGEYSPVLLHRLRVKRTFKGQPGPEIRMFQEVTSGRFEVDLGGEYLLFLHYYRYRPHKGSGSIVRGAMRVKYACGPSQRWSTVKPGDLPRLNRLAARR
jgi:hypothetical protein